MADDREEQDHRHDDHGDPGSVLRFPSKLESYNLVATIKTTRNNVVVYKAEFAKDPDAGGAEAEAETETVAIKAIPFERYSAAAFTNLVRGAESSASARPHPNLLLARHFFLDATSSRLCAVLPFLSGGSMASIISANFPYGFFHEGISAVLKEVLKALSHLHSLGICHGDIKPGNILIGASDNGDNGSYTIVLADLGLSTSVHNPAANTDCDGDDDAPYWTAPEALRSPEAYTPKSDIWAVGITALEMSQGRAPLARRNPTTASMRLKIRDRFEQWEYEDSVFTHLWSYSDEYKDMVEQCLRKDPAERPSAEELLGHPYFSMNVGDGVRPDEFHIMWAMKNLSDVDRREMAKPEPIGGGLLGSETTVYRRITGWEFNKERCFLEATFNEPDQAAAAAASGEDKVVEGLLRVGRKLEDEEDKEAVMEAARRIEAAELGRAAATSYAEELCLELLKEAERRTRAELEQELSKLDLERYGE